MQTPAGSIGAGEQLTSSSQVWQFIPRACQLPGLLQDFSGGLRVNQFTMKAFLTGGALAALILLAPLTAGAQDVPTYAQPAAPASADIQIRGRIASFDGMYALAVRDEKGYVDNIQLHPGTIINPTGLTLEPGMIVSILGYNAGGYIDANEIDTPYTYDAGVPWYGGHPWNYYGPSVSIGFFFGGATWWHGGAFRGPYHYYGGTRVYSNVHVNDVVRSNPGAFHGHAFVAPAAHGGYYPHGGSRGGASHGNGHGH
jgi:hypothetical protein